MCIRDRYYVIFLELAMGLIFFYITFLGIPWAKKKKTNVLILSGVLLVLLMLFAYPVSYTHLDVYKRQLKPLVADGIICISICAEVVSKQPSTAKNKIQVITEI